MSFFMKKKSGQSPSSLLTKEAVYVMIYRTDFLLKRVQMRTLAPPKRRISDIHLCFGVSSS